MADRILDWIDNNIISFVVLWIMIALLCVGLGIYYDSQHPCISGHNEVVPLHVMPLGKSLIIIPAHQEFVCDVRAEKPQR